MRPNNQMRGVLMNVVGVDGCKAGWVAASLHLDYPQVTFTVFRTAAELFHEHRSAACIAIDIPIGLRDGPRECDVLARRFIGARSSSVFPAPCRAVLAYGDHYSAKMASLSATGKMLTIQAFAIVPKIREIDELMTPDLQGRVREVHPEVCFTALQGEPMKHNKKGSDGYLERVYALAAAIPRLELPLRSEASKLVRGAAPDDVLDAVVAAWTARRVVRGEAKTLPVAPPLDSRGLRMEMVF